MGQKDGEKWTAAVDLQPTTPKSDRLLLQRNKTSHAYDARVAAEVAEVLEAFALDAGSVLAKLELRDA